MLIPNITNISRRDILAADLLTRTVQLLTQSKLQLNPTDHFDYPVANPESSYVLYTHIPFCESLCPYCSFNRFIYKEDRARVYFQQLREEMRMVADRGYKFVSMYIGGGTPTVLVDELVKTIDLAKELFPIKDVSCETNPNHLTQEVLGPLQGRVDRLSVGIQSFDDTLLKQMSRYERYGSGQSILKQIQSVIGILPSINIDLIFNFPSQTLEMLQKDLEYVLESNADQVTFYPLMSSPSVEKAMSRSVGAVDYKREAEYYHLMNSTLSQHYKPMSAWTYSRQGKGMIDEYIVEYGNYVGIGSGSISYLEGRLHVNTFSLRQYGEAIAQKRLPVSGVRQFGKIDQMRYRFMMELFDLQLNKERFSEDFSGPIELMLPLEMAFMSLNGAFRKGSAPGKLELTEKSRYLLVVMMREFFASVNLLRDQARQALEPSERLMCVVNEQDRYSLV